MNSEDGQKLEIRFYTREGCHLCVSALQVVRRVVERLKIDPASVLEIDIDQEPKAYELYNERVPVCFVGERHVFDYRCDESALEAVLLENSVVTPPADSITDRLHLAVDARTLRVPMTGVGRYTLSMLQALARLEGGPRLTCYVNSLGVWESVDWPDHAQALVTDADLESHPGGDWGYHRALPKRILAASPFDWPPPDAFWGPAFQVPWKLDAIPRIVTLHDLAAFLHPDTMPWKFAVYLRWLVRGSVKRADAVVAVSESTKKDALRILGLDEASVRVILEGPMLSGDSEANTSDTSKDAMEAPPLQLASDDREGLPFYLFVGALEPRKNIEFLLNVFEELKAQGDERLLVLCGPSGWKNAEIRRALENSPAKNDIVHLKYIPDAELRWLYRNAVALLFPSVYEGFGLPPLEAAAFGTPAFVSDQSSLPEVAADGRFVLPLEKDVWVRTLLSPPALKPAELQAHAATFNWAKAAEELISLIRDMTVK